MVGKSGKSAVCVTTVRKVENFITYKGRLCGRKTKSMKISCEEASFHLWTVPGDQSRWWRESNGIGKWWTPWLGSGCCWWSAYFAVSASKRILMVVTVKKNLTYEFSTIFKKVLFLFQFYFTNRKLHIDFFCVNHEIKLSETMPVKRPAQLECKLLPRRDSCSVYRTRLVCAINIPGVLVYWHILLVYSRVMLGNHRSNSYWGETHGCL